MANPMSNEKTEQALDGIAAVAPPVPASDSAPKGSVKTAAAAPAIRDAHDAGDVADLDRDPTHADAKLNVELDASFPGSDAPSTTRPGTGEPAPSSGYDPEAEKALRKAR